MNIRKAARNALPFLRHRMPSDVKPRRKRKRASGGGAHRTPRGQKTQRKIKKRKERLKNIIKICVCQKFLSLCTSRAPTRQAVPPRKYGRTFVLIPKYFAIKIQVNSIFISKSLCMSNFCCTFAEDFRSSTYFR